MPSPVAHTLAGCCVAAAAARSADAPRGVAFVAAAVAVANLPDVDFLLGPLLRPFGIALAHQGATHTLAFVAAAALFLALALRARTRPLPAWGWLLAAGASHLLLDLLSYNGRAGVRLPLLWPLSRELQQVPTLLLLFPGADRHDPVSLHNALELLVELATMVPLLWLLLRRNPAPAPGCCASSPCGDTGQRDAP